MHDDDLKSVDFSIHRYNRAKVRGMYFVSVFSDRFRNRASSVQTPLEQHLCPEVERVEATGAQQVAAYHARIPGIPWIPWITWITGLTGLTGVTEALAQLGTANSLGTRAGLSAVDSEVLLLTTCFLVAERSALRHWRVEGS